MPEGSVSARRVATTEFITGRIVASYPSERRKQNWKKYIGHFKCHGEYPSLGRREDLAVITEVIVTEVNEMEIDENKYMNENYYAYVPLNYYQDIGTEKETVQEFDYFGELNLSFKSDKAIWL